MGYSRYHADVERRDKTVLRGVSVDILDMPGAGQKAFSGRIYLDVPPALFVGEFCTIVYEGNRLDVVINAVSGASFVGFDALGGPY